MKRSHKFIITCMTVCLAGAITLPAEEGKRDKQSDRQTSGAESGKTKQNTPDLRFLEEISKAGMAEVKMAELGTQKAQSDSVKQFAQKMLRDHQEANQKAEKLCTQKGIAKSTELEREHQKMIDHLTSLSGAEFDKAFIDHAVKDHKKDVKKFEKEADRGDDPAIRSFARETLPALQEHLRIAQALQDNPNASVPELREPAGAEIKGSIEQGQQDQQKDQNQQPSDQQQQQQGQQQTNP